ncbi:GNAT family N-acetyltransferase [Nonomuraea sp. CA-143628]|uniref:GNAT family N-acetyltransferase n=1 Tax=Nonomuraea sp. CA-143628 TaxID=3239997 RepID=UPI003D8B4BF7
MLVQLLWKPLPVSWPEAVPQRPTGLRGLVAWAREVAVGVSQDEDVERRVRRGAMQAIVREAFQQTVAEQDSEHRGPAAFAEAWKTRLAAVLAQETVEVTGWGQLTIAELDTGLGRSLYDAASRARAETIARAVVMPGRRRGADDGPTVSHEFSIAADEDGSLGRVQYAVCEPCGVGLLKKISFSPEWHCCGFGTLALRELETRHPGLTWYTTGQYAHAQGFYQRYRHRSDSPWTANQHPCPHF